MFKAMPDHLREAVVTTHLGIQEIDLRRAAAHEEGTLGCLRKRCPL